MFCAEVKGWNGWVFSEAYYFGTSFVLCILPQHFKFNPPVNFHRLCTGMEPKSFPTYMSFLIRHLLQLMADKSRSPKELRQT